MNKLINEFYQSGGVGQSEVYKDLLNSIKYIEVSICKKPHRYDNKFSTLNESQEYFMEGRRHQCVQCI